MHRMQYTEYYYEFPGEEGRRPAVCRYVHTASVLCPPFFTMYGTHGTSNAAHSTDPEYDGRSDDTGLGQQPTQPRKEVQCPAGSNGTIPNNPSHALRVRLQRELEEKKIKSRESRMMRLKSDEGNVVN